MSFLKKTSSVKTNTCKALVVASALSFSFSSFATVVEVDTNFGTFQVNLFDQETPETVENFLGYVNRGDYANNVVHRSIAGFVMQAGGFTYNNSLPLDNVPTNGTIQNEPVLSNVRGTLAMAKSAGNPNSASSQWFVNLGNNASNLDDTNGGFTVFGQVIGDGMQVVDEIVDTPTFNFGDPFANLPLRDITFEELSGGAEFDDTNLVIINDIRVIDAAEVTNPDLVPVRNTLLNTEPPSDTPDSDSSDSGGALGAVFIGFLALLGLQRRRKPQ
jgi:peptidyl-prolyl cis-trans isomerase A (cyclophilin A)